MTRSPNHRCKRLAAKGDSQTGLDIQVPVLDGYDAIRQITALVESPRYLDCRAGSFAMKGDEQKARASGRDGYVTKVHSPVQLLGVNRGYLGEDARTGR
jgi:CheY-like chemotaxis protein